MRVCHIVGAGEFREDTFRPRAEDMIIAVDGGLARCPRYDMAVGDFDSLGYVPQNGPVFRHPVMKDDTDMMLAVRMALEHGCTTLYLHGGAGGRTDHTMANYHVLAFIAEQGAQGYLFDGNGCVTCLQNGALIFPTEHRGVLSVFAWDGEARGVDLEGLLYPLQNGTLNGRMPLGVSNEFTGQTASVRVREGKVLVFWQDPVWPMPERNT